MIGGGCPCRRNCIRLYLPRDTDEFWYCLDVDGQLRYPNPHGPTRTVTYQTYRPAGFLFPETHDYRVLLQAENHSFTFTPTDFLFDLSAQPAEVLLDFRDDEQPECVRSSNYTHHKGEAYVERHDVPSVTDRALSHVAPTVQLDNSTTTTVNVYSANGAVIGTTAVEVWWRGSLPKAVNDLTLEDVSDDPMPESFSANLGDNNLWGFTAPESEAILYTDGMRVSESASTLFGHPLKVTFRDGLATIATRILFSSQSGAYGGTVEIDGPFAEYATHWDPARPDFITQYWQPFMDADWLWLDDLRFVSTPLSGWIRVGEIIDNAGLARPTAGDACYVQWQFPQSSTVFDLDHPAHPGAPAGRSPQHAASPFLRVVADFTITYTPQASDGAYNGWSPAAPAGYSTQRFVTSEVEVPGEFPPMLDINGEIDEAAELTATAEIARCGRVLNLSLATGTGAGGVSILLATIENPSEEDVSGTIDNANFTRSGSPMFFAGQNFSVPAGEVVTKEILSGSSTGVSGFVTGVGGTTGDSFRSNTALV